MKSSFYSLFAKKVKGFLSVVNLIALVAVMVLNLSIVNVGHADGPIPAVATLVEGTSDTDVDIQFFNGEAPETPIDLIADLNGEEPGTPNLWETMGANLDTNYSSTNPAGTVTNPDSSPSKSEDNLTVHLHFAAPVNASDSFWHQVGGSGWTSVTVFEGEDGGDPPDGPSISDVVLTDADTENYGLDGRDFHITWTPGTAPAGFTPPMRVVIVPVDTLVTVGNVMTTGCAGHACNFYGWIPNIATNSITLEQYIKQDGNGPEFAEGTAYKACIFVNATADELSCSAGTSMSFEEVADTEAPFINHMSTFGYKSGNVMTIYAKIMDEQTTANDFVTNPDAVVSMFYDGATENIIDTEVEGTLVAGSDNLFQFQTTAPLARPLHYFLKAVDAEGNKKYFTSDPSLDQNPASTDEDAMTKAFNVMPMPAGENSVSGTIRNSSGAGLGAALVFINGYGVEKVTADGSGVYTFTEIPGGVYDIGATKIGFCEQMRNGENVGSNRTGLDITLNSGMCFYGGGDDGGGPGGGKPHPVFTFPPQNDNFAPIDGPYFVGFNQALTSSTINDGNAGDNASNIYLTTGNGTTKIPGSVTYCPDNTAEGCEDVKNSDHNVIVFNPTEFLAENTFYALVITGAVTSEMGQSIEGNRPGGGMEVRFSTGKASFGGWENIGDNFGSGGAFMPSYVSSSFPAPGMRVPSNSKLVVEFNDPLDEATVITDNFVLFSHTEQEELETAVELDSTKKIVVISPLESLSEGEYELRVLGAVSNIIGVPMRDQNNQDQPAFSLNFISSGDEDDALPLVYPMLESGSAGVPVNRGFFEFGFSDSMDPTTMTTSTVTLSRGSSSVSSSVKYYPGKNSLFLIPDNVLASNTTYTVTLTTDITGIAGNPIGLSDVTYTYTTGPLETTPPKIREARCDDVSCAVFFTEPMNNDAATGSNYATSVINPTNWTLTGGGAPGGAFTDNPISYDPIEFSVKIMSVEGIAAGDMFTITVDDGVTDIGGNAVASGGLSFGGKSEDSSATYGNFGGGGGMYGPPMGGGGGIGMGGMGGGVGGEFKPEGFGSFTAEQFMFGNADMAYPFNNMASKDVNVFQTRFVPGIELLDGDQIVLTFPAGTTVTNAVPDTQSPFFRDFNEFADGVIRFDTGFNGDGVAADEAARTVTAQLDISGTIFDDAPVIIDLRKIINPSIPKGPESGGYTIGIKVKRGENVLLNKTSTPYFIMSGGSNTININMFAGSSDFPVAGADGDVFVFGGGPAGPMDKQVTLTDGEISAVEGNEAELLEYTSLPDGCYHIGTQPFVTLGDDDYFGKDRPEPICVRDGQTVERDIVLRASSVSANVPITVKFEGVDSFDGANIDIFAGGPGNFVVKTLTNVGEPNADGYVVKLPSNGRWFLGMGPAMSKGPSTKTPDPLPVMPPPPIDLNVAGVGTEGVSVTTGFKQLPDGVEFDSETNTLTYTFETADKSISGTVTDGTNPLTDIEVRLQNPGVGAPIFTKTKADGTFAMNIANYGGYELCASKPGLPPRCEHIEMMLEGETDVIYFRGKPVAEGNPLILKLKKPAYYISGKVLDANNSGIGYAPVFATSTIGDFANGGTDQNGNYTIYVDAGTWTVNSNMPPSKTDTCATFSTTVVVTTANKTSQNIIPTGGTCYTLSGTVTVNDDPLDGVPVSIESWNAETDQPSGGMFKPTGTNGDGDFEVIVVGDTTYRVRTWTPDFGELSTTVEIGDEDATADITVTTGAVTFAFTGGTADMEGMIQLRKSDDKHTQMNKPVKDLSSNVTMNVNSGTYTYFINLFGGGNFTGTVATGATATIDLTQYVPVALTGNVKDSNGNNLKKVLITAKNTTTGLSRSTTTDASGNYSLKVKGGTYRINATLNGYILDQTPVDTVITDATTYNIGPETANGSMEKAAYVISGTVYKSDGETPANGGFASVENEDGLILTSPVSAQDGSYSIAVSAGSWTLSAISPLHAKTTEDAAIPVINSDIENADITLTADETNVVRTLSQSIAANVGGSFSDSDLGVSFTADSGVLESGSGSVKIDVQTEYTAPTTQDFVPLGDKLFEFAATGSASTLSEFNGTTQVELDFSDILDELPVGVEETDLVLAYFDEGNQEWIPVEGGSTVDTSNNSVTGLTDHFTNFALVYPSIGGDGDDEDDDEGDGPSGGGTAQIDKKTVDSDEVAETEDQSVVDLGVTGFEDITTHWAKTYIEDLFVKKIISGADKSHFKPSDSVTRAEFIKMAVNMFSINLPAVTASPFGDVGTGKWYAPYVLAAKTTGLVGGYDDNTFRPTQNISRAEAVKILLAATGFDETKYYESQFTDVPGYIWYAAYVNYAAINGIVGGDGKGNFNPGKSLTRAEAAKIVSLMLTNGYKLKTVGMVLRTLAML